MALGEIGQSPNFPERRNKGPDLKIKIWIGAEKYPDQALSKQDLLEETQGLGTHSDHPELSQ